MHRLRALCLVFLLVSLAAVVAPAPLASAAFPRWTGFPFNIPSGTTAPVRAAMYPQTFNVSGLVGAVSHVTIDLDFIQFPFADDLDILLVGPGGQSVILMSDIGAGSSPAFNSVSYAFDDAAAGPMPSGSSAPPSGSYRPTNIAQDADTFPAPAPAIGSN
jgi:hypothetical protein